MKIQEVMPVAAEKAVRRVPIGVVARQAGITVETVRYYERTGLLPKPPRSGGGHRLYDQETIRRLTFIRRSRALGFSLDEVRALMAMTSDGGACGPVRALTLAHLREIRSQIAELQRMERGLVELVERCLHAEGRRCPVLETLLGD